MAEKRAHPDDEPVQNGAKRPRSNNTSPAPAAAPPITNGKSSIQDQIAAAKERAAAARARIVGAKPASPGPAAPAQQSPAEAARARIEAMKARVSAATARSASHQTSVPAAHTLQPPSQDEGHSRGLGATLHPLLLGETGIDVRTKTNATTKKDRKPHSSLDRSSFETSSKPQLDLSGPSLDEIKKNPYYDPNIAGSNAVPRARKSREIIFNQKGKYIAQANALRRQQQLEEMKARIARQAKLAGLEEDRSEQAFVVPQPPKIEWWDEGLVEGTGPDLAYPNFDDDDMATHRSLKIGTEDSIITRYVQHPVLLDPPQAKTMPPPKPLYLTSEEQAKMRRQRRRAELQEKQAKQRLGLIEPEKPKVSQKNLMRVLGEEAVRDPTAIEARVNREIAGRRETHEQMNSERQLTKEQRHEKLQRQQEGDAAKGILVAVYRIDSLAYGKHRYQIDVNAKQQSLTGITILNPHLNLVIVEGGEHSMRQYDKLIMQRIKWSEIAPAREATKEPKSTVDKEIEQAKWLQPEDESGQLRDTSENRCIKIWEGEVKQRSFKKWGSRVAHSDQEARSVLEKAKMENMWQLAKNWSR